MQLAKNLYLNPSKNPLRKAKEIVIAWQLEQALSKRRIFEIYLNVVEWGRDVYGAEAASRHYFAKSAANLDIREAATLAALLPNPRNTREKKLIYRRNLILNRMAESDRQAARNSTGPNSPQFSKKSAKILRSQREKISSPALFSAFLQNSVQFSATFSAASRLTN